MYTHFYGLKLDKRGHHFSENNFLYFFIYFFFFVQYMYITVIRKNKINELAVKHIF